MATEALHFEGISASRKWRPRVFSELLFQFSRSLPASVVVKSETGFVSPQRSAVVDSGPRAMKSLPSGQ
jgi:hypothetical protein